MRVYKKIEMLENKYIFPSLENKLNQGDMQYSSCFLTVITADIGPERAWLLTWSWTKLTGPIQREKTESKRGVQFVPTYCTYRCCVGSTSLVFGFGCSCSLVTAWGKTGERQTSATDLDTDGSYLSAWPGLAGSSKRSPQTRHGVRDDGGEGGGEGGGGWGGLCWRTPPPGDSVPCHWAPVEGRAKMSASRSEKWSDP